MKKEPMCEEKKMKIKLQMNEDKISGFFEFTTWNYKVKLSA